MDGFSHIPLQASISPSLAPQGVEIGKARGGGIHNVDGMLELVRGCAYSSLPPPSPEHKGGDAHPWAGLLFDSQTLHLPFVSCSLSKS